MQPAVTALVANLPNAKLFVGPSTVPTEASSPYVATYPSLHFWDRGKSQVKSSVKSIFSIAKHAHVNSAERVGPFRTDQHDSTIICTRGGPLRAATTEQPVHGGDGDGGGVALVTVVAATDGRWLATDISAAEAVGIASAASAASSSSPAASSGMPALSSIRTAAADVASTAAANFDCMAAASNRRASNGILGSCSCLGLARKRPQHA